MAYLGGGGGGGGGGGRSAPGGTMWGAAKRGRGEEKGKGRNKEREREGEREREREREREGGGGGGEEQSPKNRLFFLASQKYKNGSQTYDNLAMYAQKVENDLCRRLLSVSISLFVVLRPELPTTTIHLDCVYSLMIIL